MKMLAKQFKILGKYIITDVNVNFIISILLVFFPLLKFIIIICKYNTQ